MLLIDTMHTARGLVGVLALSIASCGVRTDHHATGPNQFRIEANAADSYSQAEVLEEAYDEARTACHGPYRIVDSVDHSQGPDAARRTSGVRELILNIECAGARVAAAAATPAATGFWCARSADNSGMCFRGSAESCEALRAKSPHYGACQSQEHAVCSGDNCFVDAGSCGSAERSQGRDGSACADR
jgi:hypothetical protein